MGQLKALWRGDLELRDAFWNWAVFGGLLVNLASSALFLVLLSLDQPLPAFVIGYGFSIPYNVFVVVGVWRSADRHGGPQFVADLMRWATVVLMAVLSLT